MKNVHYYCKMLNEDIFGMFEVYLNWADMCSLARTNRLNNTIFKSSLDKHTRFGSTYLYRRQERSINEIIERFKEKTKCRLFAPVSYGKTLIGLHIAMSYVQYDNVFIIVPPTIISSWKKQITNYLYNTIKPKKIQDRQILICPDMSALGVAYLKSPNSKPKIYVVTYSMMPKIMDNSTITASLLILDEAHTYGKQQKELLRVIKFEPKILTLGATRRDTTLMSKIVDQTEDVKMESIMPNYTLNLNFGGLSSIKFDDFNEYKHVILLTDASPSKTSMLDTNRLVYKKTEQCRSLTTYDNFVKTGGIYWSSIKRIIEGVNLNHCNKLIIIQDNGLLIDRVRQLVGRVIRQSAVYRDIEIIVRSRYYVNIARYLLLDVNFTGVDVMSNDVAEYYIKKYGIEVMRQMPKIVRLTLLCQNGVLQYNDTPDGLHSLLSYL